MEKVINCYARYASPFRYHHLQYENRFENALPYRDQKCVIDYPKHRTPSMLFLFSQRAFFCKKGGLSLILMKSQNIILFDFLKYRIKVRNDNFATSIDNILLFLLFFINAKYYFVRCTNFGS